MKIRSSLRRASAALCLLAATTPALADEAGPYAIAAYGQARYGFDCTLLLTCNSGHAGAVKLGLGYPFGGTAVELWATDWGKANTHPNASSTDHVHLRSLGVGAAWDWHITGATRFLLRAGLAQVHQRRDAESVSSAEVTLGLGLLVDVAPQVAVELGLDGTSSTGGSEHIGTVFARNLSAGLRLRF